MLQARIHTPLTGTQFISRSPASVPVRRLCMRQKTRMWHATISPGWTARLTRIGRDCVLLGHNGNERKFIERSVSVAMGRVFTGLTGDGKLSANGHADVDLWPGLSAGGEVTGAPGAVRGGSLSDSGSIG